MKTRLLVYLSTQDLSKQVCKDVRRTISAALSTPRESCNTVASKSCSCVVKAVCIIDGNTDKSALALGEYADSSAPVQLHLQPWVPFDAESAHEQRCTRDEHPATPAPAVGGLMYRASSIGGTANRLVHIGSFFIV